MYDEFDETDGFAESENYDTAFDALMGFLNYLSENTVKVINLARYKTMMQTAAELKEILSAGQGKGEFDVEICDLLNYGAITVTLDELVAQDTALFAAMIARADNFEVYPRTDGRIQLNIMFYAMLDTVD